MSDAQTIALQTARRMRTMGAPMTWFASTSAAPTSANLAIPTVAKTGIITAATPGAAIPVNAVVKAATAVKAPMSTGEKVAIAVGVVALAGGAWWFLRKGKGRRRNPRRRRSRGRR